LRARQPTKTSWFGAKGKSGAPVLGVVFRMALATPNIEYTTSGICNRIRASKWRTNGGETRIRVR